MFAWQYLHDHILVHVASSVPSHRCSCDNIFTSLSAWQHHCSLRIIVHIASLFTYATSHRCSVGNFSLLTWQHLHCSCGSTFTSLFTWQRLQINIFILLSVWQHLHIIVSVWQHLHIVFSAVSFVCSCSFLGLDIPFLDNVINYSFPSKPKSFIHRVGRVARAGRKGRAYSLVAPDESPYMLDLYVYLGRKLCSPENVEKYDETEVNITILTVFYVDGNERALNFVSIHRKALKCIDPRQTQKHKWRQRQK